MIWSSRGNGTRGHRVGDPCCTGSVILANTDAVADTLHVPGITQSTDYDTTVKTAIRRGISPPCCSPTCVFRESTTQQQGRILAPPDPSPPSPRGRSCINLKRPHHHSCRVKGAWRPAGILTKDLCIPNTPTSAIHL